MPDDFTFAELNALALAQAEIDLLSDLVAMRRAKGMTQEQVAAEIRRNKSAVSRFERLDSDPRLSTVRRYARAVGADIEVRVKDFVAPVNLRLVQGFTVTAEQDAETLRALYFGAEADADEGAERSLVMQQAI